MSEASSKQLIFPLKSMEIIFTLLPLRGILSYVKGYDDPASLIFKTVEWVEAFGNAELR